MSTYQWLLFLHVTGAFLFVGGAVAAAVFSMSAQRSDRPSEIALLLRLARLAIPVIGVGALLTLVVGLWLVHAAEQGYSFGDGWVIGALVLWATASAAGGIGGRHEKQTRLRAERLAREADAPDAELRARLRNPFALALNWGSGVVLLGVLALMIWKPGA